MPFTDLFKSKHERGRIKEKRRRKAFRDAENAVDIVKERVAKLKHERDKSWTEARHYLKDGQKAASRRCLQACRASEMLVGKLEIKRWIFEQILSKLELSKSDQDFTNALEALNTVIEVNPEAIVDVLDNVQDKLGEQADSDKIWERMYSKELDSVNTIMTDYIPSLEEMEKQLQDEAVMEVGSGEHEPAASNTELKQRIGEGRKKLSELLENDS